ncbi:MAG: hypothetical protein SGARI_005076, partial [Bacillariaceae sp.]
MRFFGGKENGTVAVDANTVTPRRSAKKTPRKFGTPLERNLHTTPDSKSLRSGSKSSVKKIVRVRRTPQAPTFTDKNEKTVIFTPGPVGLQLEPVNEDPCYGCRIVRFVDGGPNKPGQARQSNKIKPGDLVLKVEAEGTAMAATTYEEIIKLLKHTNVRRILTVQSVWEDGQLVASDDTKVSAPTPPSKISAMTLIPTRKAPQSSKA